MRTAKVKGISFSDEYKREYDYVMGIKSASKYVCELIKKDLDERCMDIEKHNEMILKHI